MLNHSFNFLIMRKKNLLFLLFTLLVLPATGQPTSLQNDIEEAQKIAEAYYLEHYIPGMSISVYRNGDIAWSQGFGYADVENKVPVVPGKTLFRIGSVSKTYTAAAVGLLVQDGSLDLDASIHTYVPSFPRKKYDVTVEQVAGHLAGIRHYRGEEFMSSEHYPTVESGLTIFKDDTLLFEPGSNYSYSSYGWNLVSAAVEGASGEDFITFMETEVFQPLNMNHTLPDYANRDIPDRTKFYVYEDDANKEAPYVDNSYKWAGGGFLSTTEDMIAFGEAHLTGDFLEQEPLERLMRPLAKNNGESTNYGIGWATITTPDGNTWKGHSGGSVGGSTMFLLHRQNEVVIAFAINRSSAPMADLRDELAKIFID